MGFMFLRTLLIAAASFALCGVDYVGTPDLAVTASIVQAGGGPQHYDSGTMFRVLAGRLAGLEMMKLRMQFGRPRVDAFLKSFDFAIAALLHDRSLELPPQGSLDLQDGRGVARALLARGTQPSGAYDVGYMLDHLLSHDLHARICTELDARYGDGSSQNYHQILAQVIADMKRANRL